MVHNVIFDFGNVLGTLDKHLSCKRLADYSKSLSAQEIYNLLVDGELEKSAEMGFIDSETFAQRIIEAIDAPTLSPERCIKIWGDIFTHNHGMIELVTNLKNHGIAIVVLSNTNGVHWQYVRKLDVIRFLEEWGVPFILSYELGVMKPDPIIYRSALSALGCAAEDAVFIDDIPENVDAARKLGMAGIEYNGSVQSVDYLRDKLNRILA